MGFLHNLSKDDKRAAMDALGQGRIDGIVEQSFRGANIRGSKSVSEGLGKANADFEVGLRPLLAIIDKGTTAEVNGKYASVRLKGGGSLTDIPLGVVGAGYVTHPHSIAFAAAQAMVEAGSLELMSCWQEGGGRRVGLEGLIGLTEVGRLSSGEPDIIAQALSIETSHDGSRSTTASRFAVRLICDNGMTSFELANRVRIPHTSRSVDHLKVATALISNMAEKAIEETELFQTLAKKTMTKKQFANFVEDLFNAVRRPVTKQAPSSSLEGEIEAWERSRARRDTEIEELVSSFSRGTTTEGADHGGSNQYGAYNVVTDSLTPRPTEERYADAARFARSLIGEREGHSSRVRSQALRLLQRRR